MSSAKRILPVVLGIVALAAILVSALLWLGSDEGGDLRESAKHKKQAVQEVPTVQEGEIDSAVAQTDDSAERVAIERKDLFLAGRVIDKRTREPVKTFYIWAYAKPLVGERKSWKPVRIAKETVRDDRGAFCYRLEGGGLCTLHVSSSRYPRKSLENIKISMDEKPAEILIELDPGWSVSGRVVSDATGNPVEGAIVSANRGIGFLMTRPQEYREQFMHSVSDDMGRFILLGLKAGSRRIRAIHPDHGAGGADTLIGSGAEIEIRLEPGFAVYGTVRDDQDQLCEGAMVQILVGGAGGLNTFLLTDSKGSYRFFPVLPGQVHVWAKPPRNDKEGSSSWTSEIKSATIVDRDVEVNFGPGPNHIEWRGTFYGYDGKPQSRGLVRIDAARTEKRDSLERFSRSRSGWCDDEGRFRIGRILPGTYTVTLSLSNNGKVRDWKRITLKTPGFFEMDIRLPRLDAFGELKGVVVDSSSGGPPQADQCYVGVIPHNTTGRSRFTGRIDEEGRFHISDLPPGICDLEVQAEGYPTKMIRNILVPEGKSTVSIRIELDAGGELVVRLSGFSEEPRRNVQISTLKLPVAVADACDCQWWRLRNHDSEMSFRREAGDWLVRLAFKGDYSVEKSCTVVAGKRTEVVITPEDLLLSVESVSIAGRFLHVDATPIPGARLRFISMDMMQDTEYVSLAVETVTDSQGAFSAQGFRWGTWLAEYVSEDFRPILASFRIPHDSGDPFMLDLIFPDGTVSGALFDSATDMPIDARGPRWTVYLDADKTYTGGNVNGLWNRGEKLTLFGIPRGRYRVKIYAEGFKDHVSKPFDHPGTGNVDLGIITLER